MTLAFIKNPIVRFLVSILLLLLLWYCLYNLWLHPNETLDLFVIDKTLSASKWILELLGYSVYTGVDRLIGVDGASGLWMGDNCNAISLFAQFSGFIIAYPGKIKFKVPYIIMGILSIEVLNIIRVVTLAILDTKSRAWTEFNHTYTFTIIIYAFIFMLWMIWVNKFSSK
jgi:exosortase family protein XrtF